MSQEAKDNRIKIHPLIIERWSPRSFDSKVPSEEDIVKLLEAARWAPSSFNEQPWRFIIGVKGDEAYEKLSKCLNEWNQKWALGAPVLMMVCGKETFSKNDKPNNHFKYDSGAAMANLSLQATALGLRLHQMGGILPEKVKTLFQLPDGYVALTGVAIGYEGKPEDIDEQFQESEKAPRTRKPLNEICFGSKWNRPFIQK